MEKYILIFHFILALALIGLILLQQGKGAEVGASFGAGASQTMFGSSGSWNFFSKLTAILATIFFATSISLALIAKNRLVVDNDVLPELESVPQETLKESEIPNVNSAAKIPASDLPDVPAGEGEIPQN